MGPVGPAAAAGATNVVTRTNSASIPAVSTGSAVVQCQLVGSGPVDISGTLPMASGSVPTGWRVEVDNTTGVGLNAVANAICVAP